MKSIKLELPPDHLDVVMRHLLEGKMKDVNNTVNLIMQQANDPAMQGSAVAANSKSGEPTAQSGGSKETDIAAAVAAAAPLLAATMTAKTSPKQESQDG